MSKNKVKVAVIQAGSVLFDSKKSVLKAQQWIFEAVKNDVKLVLLPEAFVPGYPRGLSFGTVVGRRNEAGRSLWKDYFVNSLLLNSEEIEILCKTAKKFKIHLVLGISEIDEKTKGTLYCTLLYIGPNGKILGKHRKIKPTAAERYVWGEGNEDLFPVINTEFGNIGGLICWENYMPLARMALYRQGVDIYLAPTADFRESWQATLRHIACEGRCFVLGCNQFITPDSYPEEVLEKETGVEKCELFCKGGSAIISPLGEVIAGPLYGKEGILHAELDLDQVIESRFDFDVNGHYQRPDLFNFELLPTSTIKD